MKVSEITTTAPEETVEDAGGVPADQGDAAEQEDAAAASYYLDLSDDDADVDDRSSRERTLGGQRAM